MIQGANGPWVWFTFHGDCPLKHHRTIQDKINNSSEGWRQPWQRLRSLGLQCGLHLPKFSQKRGQPGSHPNMLGV